MKEYRIEDLFIGMQESFEVVLEEKHMNLFAEISGDTNPLHTQVEYAKSQGFVDKVTYGLLTTSFYSRLAGMYLPGKYCLLHGI
ncbi:MULTISPECIES: MaoC/PaaZ C-terminal domain-containing protein [unclassified Helicobacter]|uniref:MaoC/PaaZ C-terminal domain-containing protein n=1 Tax=unclassified Helicobacter TaxID=2593540 RepID=UPI000CF17673|nr:MULTISPECIES: MaoC/PaaZ C-terminal domain-containing protein [unclassified Helicobacter]